MPNNHIKVHSIIGKNITRVDAYEKVTGRAMYTDDLACPGMLVGKVVRSTIGNGVVKAFDLSEALAVPGVVKILTCFDVPDVVFPTPGHPWSTDPNHQDVSDRKLLNQRVRIYGDDIAVVIAENEIAADQAVRKIAVTYQKYPVVTSIEQAMAADEPPIHAERPGNLLKHTGSRLGSQSFAQACDEKDLYVLEKTYKTQAVQHCHIEPPVSHAWMENGRIVVVTSTQIPHIVRRVIGQALDIPWGKIRVIKPYIGGGFGNKQEVLYEPLNAWLTTQVGGRAVRLCISREETFSNTRTRHAMDIQMRTAVRADGTLVARTMAAYSNQGGYASHGHAIVANTTNVYRMLYNSEKMLSLDAYTVLTNAAVGGAMRGYGIPQAIFAIESHMDDLAAAIGIDPIAIRLRNCMQEGFADPGTGIICHSSGLRACIEKGRQSIQWDQKRKAYTNQTGNLRRGIGMAIFCYKTGVYPISLETATCRMVLNQDGSIQLQMGATEIGQGADTVFAQMAAQTLGISVDKVHMVSTQDTDVTPFDTGAYASRQTYVSGKAVCKTAQSLRGKLLQFAAGMLARDAQQLDIVQDQIVDQASGDPLLAVGDVAMEAFYSLTHSVHITAEETVHCTDNTFAFGACFAEVEVDIPVGKIKVLHIINVHDSGVLINPKLAEAQVHGGMSMGLGYGLSEEMLYDEQARLRNGNLLDYKLPTAMDTPELQVAFVETNDPTGPYGNKALGEPPAIPPAPALRNAVLHATGVAIDTLPLHPQKLVQAFVKAGLIEMQEERRTADV